MITKAKLLFLVGMYVLSAVTLADGNAEAGKGKSEVCVACHQVDGNSVNPIWPKLAGQQANYLYKQLKDFKRANDPAVKNSRNNPSMTALVANLSDQDMQDLAAYYAKQSIQPGTAQPQFVELGQKIYRGGNLDTGVSACIACHGPAAMGNNPAKFPRLSGQYPDYTIAQMKAFRDGSRKNGPMMIDIAKRMSDAEIEAVAHYVAGLQD